ncbi:MAG: porin [Simplicispira sp.]|nr:porin [Simplicispira sp.]
MKRSLIALAVLGTFAGVASAQSSVALYGRADAGLGKPFGGKSQDQ